MIDEEGRAMRGVDTRDGISQPCEFCAWLVHAEVIQHDRQH